MIEPVSTLPVAAKGAGYLMSYLGRRFEADEEERIRRSFVKTIRQVGDERRQASERNGVAGTRGKKFGRIMASTPFTAERRERKTHKGYEAEVAEELTRIWAEAPIHRAVTRSTDENGAEESSVAAVSDRDSWSGALVYFLESAALDGTGNGDGEQTAAASETRDSRRDGWRYVVASPTPGGDEADGAAEWAKRVADHVVIFWINDPRLANLVAQLNYESGYGLVQALAASGQSIARSFQQMVATTIPLTLLGGGAIALLVLYIDKG